MSSRAQRRQIRELDLRRRVLHARRVEGHPLFAVELELVVQLEATDLRQVVALGIEEEVVEEIGRGVDRRRITRAKAPVDLDDRVFLRRGLVGEQRVAQRRSCRDRIEEEQRELEDVAIAELLEMSLGQLLVALDDDLTGLLVDDVDRRHAANRVRPDQVLLTDLDPLDARLLGSCAPRPS